MQPFETGAVNFNALLVILVNVFAYMLIFYLWVGKSKENRGNIFLSFLILQFSLYVFPDFLILLGLLDVFPHAVRIYVIGSFLLGPMTYFYVRTCTENTFKLTRKMWWHFVPAILDFIYQLPFYTLSGEEKIPYAYNFYAEGGFQQPLLLTLAKMLHMLIYFVVSMGIVNKYRKHLPHTASSIDKSFHRWLFLFCFALTIPVVSGLIFSFVNSIFSATYLNLSLFMVILTALSLLVIKPSIFHQFPHQMSVQKPTEIQKEKYEGSNLREAQKVQYLEQLQRRMKADKYYQEPELTIQQLSAQIHIPSHYLSQVINEKLGCNFLDFINQYRVKAAKELLANPDFEHYSLNAIGYQAGFNSKSTFYAAFKKFTNTTPGKFRKMLITK